MTHAVPMTELPKASIRRRQILPRRHSATPRAGAPGGPPGPAAGAFASFAAVAADSRAADLGEDGPPDQLLGRVLGALADL